jgi:hypothetical protein
LRLKVQQFFALQPMPASEAKSLSNTGEVSAKP